jgi:hypothetical protein
MVSKLYVKGKNTLYWTIHVKHILRILYDEWHNVIKLSVEIATGMILLADDRRVRGHRPIVATMPQGPSGSCEAVAWIHETPALIPFDANVVVILRLLQGDATRPLLLGVLLLLGIRVARLELGLLVGPLRGEGAVEGGPGLLHLAGGHEGLLASPSVGVFL